MAGNFLDSLDPRELGQNLKMAREQRGLRQEDAAKEIDVSRTTLTAIEQGKRRIKFDELKRLAQVYGRSLSDFIRARPVARDFRVQFRAPNEAVIQRSEAIDQPQNEFQELCRDYVELETLMDAPMVHHYPSEYAKDGVNIDSVAQVIATQERYRLGLGDAPLPILRTVFEQDVGLRIFFLPFSDPQFSEMYYYDDELGGCLAVNQNHPEERRRWSLSHGYAHFLVDRFQPIIHFESLYKRELFADQFAKHFLMPSSGVTKHYNATLRSRSKPTLGDLCVLANYYGVSLSAFVRRLEDIKIAPKGTWERIRDRGFRVREAQQQHNLPPIPQDSQLLPIRYQYLAVEAYEKGFVSEGMLAKFLRVDRLEARHITQALSEHSLDITQNERVEFDIEDVVEV